MVLSYFHGFIPLSSAARMHSTARFLVSIHLCVTIVSSAPDQDDGAQCRQDDPASGPDYQSLLMSNVRVDLSGGVDAQRYPMARNNTTQAASATASASHRKAPADQKSREFPSEALAKSNQSGSAYVSRPSSGISLIVEQFKTTSGTPVLLICLLLTSLIALCCMIAIFQPMSKRTAYVEGAERDRSERTAMMLGGGLGSQAGYRSPVPTASPVPGSTVANFSPMPPGLGFGSQRPSTSAFADPMMVPPSPYATGLPTSQFDLQPGLHAQQEPYQQLAPLSKQAPPPLCPTLVMPVCEARFGVPMKELAGTTTEGTLNIVGLSGNPLLRAVLKKKSLEICMPEKNSAPRATIAPSAGDGYEIRGMKGSFYGYLRVQPTGKCYVVKDGQTVLLLDGDTEILSLSVKSGLGQQLASVRCSAEPFGGVEHVEIRVEPGVDTVLVLAVVLGVLLLSDR